MIGDALSQLGNVVWPFWSVRDTSANESISGRAHRQDWKKLKRIINLLFFWQEDHCKAAYDADLERARALVASHDM